MTRHKDTRNAPRFTFGEDTVSLDSSSSHQPSSIHPEQHVLFTVTHKGRPAVMYELYVEMRQWLRVCGSPRPSARANRAACQWLLENLERATFVREFKPDDEGKEGGE